MKSANKITALNISSSILLKGIAFITMPIFTRLLGTEQYGLYSVFFFRLDILVCIMGLGIASSLGTAIYAYKDRYLQYRSSSLLLTTFSALCFIAIGSIFVQPLAKLLNYNVLLVECLLFFALFNIIINFAQTAFIYEKKAVHNFVMSIVLAVSSIVLSLLLIPCMNSENRYVGRVLGQAIPYMVVAIIVWILCFCKRPSRIKKEYLKYGLAYGLPVILHTLAHSLLSQSDREMMVRLDISNDEVGIYSFYCVLITVLSVLMEALANSWTPFYYDGISEEKWDELTKKCRHVVELFTVLCVGFIFLSREVSVWVSSEDFWSGADIIPILVVSVYFIFLYQFPVSYEFYFKKTKVLAVGTLVSAGINILLNLVIIPRWRMYGAAASKAILYGILFAIH